MGDEHLFLEEWSLDTIFALLANRSRRTLLTTLSEHEGSQTLTHLAKTIAMEEGDEPIEELGEEINRTYLELYHAHIPKLANHGVVDYAETRTRVRLTEQATALTAVLDVIEKEFV